MYLFTFEFVQARFNIKYKCIFGVNALVIIFISKFYILVNILWSNNRSSKKNFKYFRYTRAKAFNIIILNTVSNTGSSFFCQNNRKQAYISSEIFNILFKICRRTEDIACLTVRPINVRYANLITKNPSNQCQEVASNT